MPAELPSRVFSGRRRLTGNESESPGDPMWRREHSSRNEHTRYCFLPGRLSLPPRSSRCPGSPVTRGAPSPGCPIALGCQRCLGGVWCGWAAVREPLKLFFSWPLPPFRVWGMPEEQVVPQVSLQLVAARERETHWCLFPCPHSQHPRPVVHQAATALGTQLWCGRRPCMWPHGVTQGLQRERASRSKRGSRARLTRRARCSRWP